MNNFFKSISKMGSKASLMVICMMTFSMSNAHAEQSHKAYVYTELQLSIPFSDVPWAKMNPVIKKQSGFINKTWLSGATNNSPGGFYTFNSIEDAQKFVTGYFPKEAAVFGVPHTTRIFDALATKSASKDMNSVYYGGGINKKPKAFVYTEVQVSALPFDKAVAWHDRNPVIKQQVGLLSKTWLSGLNTGTIGGFYAFDTMENAKNFAIKDFPKVAKSLNSAFYTRVFDAQVTEDASIDMHSPFYK